MSTDVIDGRYKVLAKIGEGAHGVVFQARDQETRGMVALKFLNREIAGQGEYLERLQREAEAMAQLRGTAAVYIHGLRRSENGAAYIVMEMLVGQDFEDYMKSAETVGGRLKRTKLAELLRPIVETLAQAHSLSLVHRDLKPSNIFVVDRAAGGGVRLLDFGLVKMLNNLGLTAEGLVAGTPSYIAPEAWRGKPLTLDHRIDVYSLAVIIFRALAKEVPFRSKNMVDLLQLVTRAPRPKLTAFRPDLPAEIDTWVEKALAIDPADRFQSVTELWEAVEPLLVREKPKIF